REGSALPAARHRSSSVPFPRMRLDRVPAVKRPGTRGRTAFMSQPHAATQSATVSRTSDATRLRDAWDLPISTLSRGALHAYGRSVLGLLAHRADTAAHLDAALAADAGFALPLLMRGFGLRLLARADCAADARSALRKVEASFMERGATWREALLSD